MQAAGGRAPARRGVHQGAGVPAPCIVRAGRVGTAPDGATRTLMPAGALPAALRLGQAAAASGGPGKQARHECRGTERRAAEHAEVGVQVVLA